MQIWDHVGRHPTILGVTILEPSLNTQVANTLIPKMDDIHLKYMDISSSKYIDWDVQNSGTPKDDP